LVKERLKAEQTLRQNEQYFRLLIENTLDIITILNVDGTVRYDSPSIAQVLGYKPVDRFGKIAFDLVHPDDRCQVVDSFNDIIRNPGSVSSIEFRFLHRDGSWRILEAKGRSLTDEAGVTGVLVNSRDISRRKQTEQALRQVHHDLELNVQERTAELSGINEKLRQEIDQRKRAERDLSAQYAVTLILAESNSLSDAASKILQAICENLEWEVGVIWIIDEDTNVLRCVRMRSSPNMATDEFEKNTKQTISSPGSGLVGRVWTSREPVWISDLSNAIHYRRSPSARRAGLRTVFTLPIFSEGRILGAMEFLSRDIRRPDYEMIQIMDVLGSQIGQFVERKQIEQERTQLLELEKTHRAQAEAAQQRSSFLAEASTLLASSLDYPITVARVVRLAVPQIADWCSVDIVDENQSIRTLEVAHADPAKVELARELQRRYPPDPAAQYGVPHVLRTGKPELYTEVSDSALMASARDPEHLRILRELGLKSAMVVPLATRGRRLGAITFVTAESGRPYGSEDLALAEDLARRIAIAIDNARLYSEAELAIAARERALSDLKMHLLQQAAVAELGQCALSSSDVSTVMKETARLVFNTLEVNYCEILEWLPGGQSLLLKAGLGWREGYVGKTTIEAGANSHAGYALLSREPVVIDDFNTETRFKVPAFLREHGINSGISIIIQGQEHPYGVLGAHTIKPRSFTKDEVYFLLAVANILGTAIERARMQAALRNLSLTDELTGLCNRRGFLALAEQHLKLARRLRRSVCLVFADLDDLKQINDTLGHQCGDEALVKTAEVLRETFRHSDILGRLGGDEFMALAMEDSKQTPAKILNRLRIFALDFP
jgi:PAS domain S-box-containing protein